MSRPIGSGLELTFHQRSNRWCKVIKGKRIYFGKGKSIRDRASYRAAVKAYREFMDQRELAMAVAEAAAEAAHRTMRRLGVVERREQTARAARIAQGWLDGDENAADAELDEFGDPVAASRQAPRADRQWQQTQQRMQAIAEARQEGRLYETAGALRGGRRVWMLARIPKEYRAGPEDLIKPYVLLVNSHDGSTALRMIPTTVRVVCQNTLNLALGRAAAGEGLSIRHRPSLDERVKEARAKLGVIAARFDQFDAELHAMLDATLKPRQVEAYFDDVLPPPAPQATAQQRQNRADTLGVFRQNFENTTNALPGVRGTAWAAYNAVSQWADHQRRFRGDSPQARATHRLDSIWFGSSHQIKQRAFTRALQLANAN